MPTEHIYWEWEEAFSKWGFNDGDGLVMTHEVAMAIQQLPGYHVEYDKPGCHNCYILKITYYDEEVYGVDNSVDYTPGYDDPHSMLDEAVIEHLDRTFGKKKSSRPSYEHRGDTSYV